MTKIRNLNRRGRKTRTAVTAAEVDFCAYFVLTGNAKQASLQAGYSAWWGYELLKKPRIQRVLREFESRKKDEAWETARDQIVLSRELLDESLIRLAPAAAMRAEQISSVIARLSALWPPVFVPSLRPSRL